MLVRYKLMQWHNLTSGYRGQLPMAYVVTWGWNQHKGYGQREYWYGLPTRGPLREKCPNSTWLHGGWSRQKLICTHTHTTVLRLSGFCPGQPRWAGTRRNIWSAYYYNVNEKQKRTIATKVSTPSFCMVLCKHLAAKMIKTTIKMHGQLVTRSSYHTNPNPAAMHGKTLSCTWLSLKVPPTHRPSHEPHPPTDR